jgi:hypothetical protein
VLNQVDVEESGGSLAHSKWVSMMPRFFSDGSAGSRILSFFLCLASSRSTVEALISLIGEQKTIEIRNAVLNQEAVFISREQGLAAAIQFTEAVLAMYGRIPVLEQNLNVFRSNYAGELHNNFVTLWNSGRKNEAGAFVREALKKFPQSRLLLNDLKIAEGR